MKKEKKGKQALDNIEAIKRLLIANLLLNGAKAENIAKLLDMDDSTLRHIISIKNFKKSKEKTP